MTTLYCKLSVEWLTNDGKIMDVNSIEMIGLVYSLGVRNRTKGPRSCILKLADLSRDGADNSGLRISYDDKYRLNRGRWAFPCMTSNNSVRNNKGHYSH